MALSLVVGEKNGIAGDAWEYVKESRMKPTTK